MPTVTYTFPMTGNVRVEGTYTGTDYTLTFVNDTNSNIIASLNSAQADRLLNILQAFARLRNESLIRSAVTT